MFFVPIAKNGSRDIFVCIRYVECSVKYFHAGRKFCARSSNHIIKMRKEKTFNQEVDHIIRVVDAEIVKKDH